MNKLSTTPYLTPFHLIHIGVSSPNKIIPQAYLSYYPDPSLKQHNISQLIYKEKKRTPMYLSKIKVTDRSKKTKQNPPNGNGNGNVNKFNK